MKYNVRKNETENSCPKSTEIFANEQLKNSHSMLNEIEEKEKIGEMKMDKNYTNFNW